MRCREPSSVRAKEVVYHVSILSKPLAISPTAHMARGIFRHCPQPTQSGPVIWCGTVAIPDGTWLE
jgi:hypothetical protein